MMRRSIKNAKADHQVHTENQFSINSVSSGVYSHNNCKYTPTRSNSLPVDVLKIK